MSDNGLRKNAVVKFIFALVFSLSAAAALLSASFITEAFGFMMITRDGYEDEGEYTDSYNIKVWMQNTALFTIDNNARYLLEGTVESEDPDFLIRISDADGEEIFSNIGEDDIQWSETYEVDVKLYENKDGELVYWLTGFADGNEDPQVKTTDEIEHAEPDGDMQTDRIYAGTERYTIEVAVPEHPDLHSNLGRQKYIYGFTKTWLHWYVPVLIASAIAFLAALAGTIWSAGWKKGYDTPQNSVFGKIPFDLLTVVLCGLCAAAAGGIYAMTDYFDVRVLTMPFAGYIVLLGLAFTGMDNVYLLLIPAFLIMSAIGMLNVVVTVFLANTCDYGELKNERRDESVIFSMQTFVVKLASGLAAFIASLVLSIFSITQDAEGADTANVVYQRASDASCMGLRMCMTLIPIVILIIGLIVFKAKYKLTDERLDEITKELDARHAAEGNVSEDSEKSAEA